MNTTDKNKILKQHERLKNLRGHDEITILRKLWSYLSDEFGEADLKMMKLADGLEKKYHSRSQKWQSSDKGQELLKEIQHLRSENNKAMNAVNNAQNMLLDCMKIDWTKHTNQ